MYNSSLDKWKQLWLPMPDPGPAPSSAGVQVKNNDVDVDIDDVDVNAYCMRMMKRPDPGQAPSNTDFFWCSEYAPSLVKCLSHHRHNFLGCVPSPWPCVSQEERQRAPAPSSVRLLV